MDGLQHFGWKEDRKVFSISGRFVDEEIKEGRERGLKKKANETALWVDNGVKRTENP